MNLDSMLLVHMKFETYIYIKKFIYTIIYFYGYL